ncbi:hypothetical protein HYN48_01395 [Flavobacterium magnum]|uniref:Uncharacterized protein n=1 Tax=Flavobacterium magnum TaxID=2162713 RepID=A0A2S0RCN7_9FLAO|nr:hypothetical protein [Flavobacterium magnum]AWA28851.1 hypothetical protein HYN48_01395 [Flavobacterium magnum]
MKRIYMLVVFGLTALAMGCSSDADHGGVSCNSDIPFLQAGNVALYKYIFQGRQRGDVRITYGPCDGQGFLVKTEEYFEDLGGFMESTGYYFHQEGDFLLSDANDGLAGTFWREYKKNAVAGDHWEEDLGGVSKIYEVLDVNSSLTVPAGTFLCTVIKSYNGNSPENYAIIHWNDEVGIVRSYTNYIDLNLDLKSFN